MLSLLASVAQQVPAPQDLRSRPSVWRFPRHALFTWANLEAHCF